MRTDRSDEVTRQPLNLEAPGSIQTPTVESSPVVDVLAAAQHGAPISGVPKPGGEAPIGQALNASSACQAGAELGRSPRIGAFLTTASDVERVLDAGDLSSIEPAIPRALWSYAQQIAETLKKEGPLGSHGPLGNRGPLGNHAWNPSFWMKMIGEWTELSAKMTGLGGPGSDKGSLGSSGPVSKQAYESLLPNLGPLSGQLQAGGLFGALGPLGPLGALGALGYLGQVGGHGFGQDADGRFVDADGAVQRKTDVAYEGGKRTYGLTELYTERFAEGMADNDTSWMIRGDLAPGDPEDTFTFTPTAGQVVTLTAVPESRRDVFTVELLDASGETIATSNSDAYVNWIQFQAKDDSPLKVRVRRKEGEDDSPNFVSSYIDAMLFPLRATGEAMKPWLRAAGHTVDDVVPHSYRLFSVGSPKDLSERMVSGDHQR